MTDKNGRPEYAAIADLQPRLNEKNAALDAKLRTIEKQEDEALAHYVTSSRPKKAARK
jgi:hypothetical protein